MWELVKAYVKPVGIVVLGVLGAKVIEKGAVTVFDGARNQIGKISLGQANKSQAELAATAPAPPAQTASGAPQPVNAAEVNK
jgi:hypothetical protein